MANKYDFKKRDVRDAASDLRGTLRGIEYAMRSNDYSSWNEYQYDILDIANYLVNKMKGE